MFYIGVRDIAPLYFSRRRGGRGKISPHDGFFNVQKSRIPGNGTRPLSYQLHAVIIFRIVTGRYHDAAV